MIVDLPAPADADVAGMLDPFFAAIETSDERAALRALEICRRRCEAVEAKLLAARVSTHDGDDSQARQLLRSVDSASKREKARRLQRAKLVADRPALAGQIERGELSGEVLDLLADAHRKSDGRALDDDKLIDKLASAGPDLGRCIKQRWLDDRRTRDDVEAEYRRQRGQRTVWRHQTDAGLAALTIAGDTATIDRLWARVQTGADAAYRADGGRGVAGHQHQRAFGQRCFDTVADLIDGTGTSGGAGRPAVVFTIDLESLMWQAGSDRDTPSEPSKAVQVGTGPVADAVIIDALKAADLYTLVGSPTGEPLWLGRSARTASRAQLIALIVRDQGCIATGAAWQRCEAHHVVPYGSAAQGPTDIDNLALLDPPIHRDTHARNQRWKRQADGSWIAEPAPPHEHAPRTARQSKQTPRLE